MEIDGPLTLEGRGLVKAYEVGGNKVVALDAVDVTLRAGEVVAVLGPSGSGKSTMLYVLSGLEAPDRGKVTLDGQDLYSLPDRRLAGLRNKHFGFIFQSYNLISTMTALENVEVPLRMARAPKARQRATEMLVKVGLKDRLEHRPGQLSGGEQQRVAVARALACNPTLIFADEPTGNLDSRTGSDLMDMLIGLVRQGSCGCLLVTHNPAWAELADGVLWLRDGRLERG